jgi:hypothetical protein
MMQLERLLNDSGPGGSAKGLRGSIGCKRRDFNEFEDETKKPSGRSGGGWIVAVPFIKYAAIVIIAYMGLLVLGVLRGAL